MSLSPSTVAGTHWTHTEYLLNELLMTRQSNGATLINLFLLSGQTSSLQSLGLEKSLTHCIKPQLSISLVQREVEPKGAMAPDHPSLLLNIPEQKLFWSLSHPPWLSYLSYILAWNYKPEREGTISVFLMDISRCLACNKITIVFLYFTWINCQVWTPGISKLLVCS